MILYKENMSLVCFVQLRGMIIVSTYLQYSYCHFSIITCLLHLNLKWLC